MNKIKIGIDLDSVLSDLLPYWLNFYNNDFNDNLKVENITAWETDKFVKSECGKKIFDYILQPNFFLNVPVLQGSQDAVKWLSTFDNVELYVVTAYHPYVCKDKADWLAKYFPEINQKNIIFINDKSLVDVDYLIDDSPTNCIGFKGKYLLFDYPYNQNVHESLYEMRVSNWSDVMQYFKGIFTAIAIRHKGEKSVVLVPHH